VTEPFNLQRFVDAQAPVYPEVVRELAAGRKETHWMWFIFPQIAGLGFSRTSIFFAISSLDEAKAYAAHPILGRRLAECSGLILEAEGRTARQIFGGIDETKFRSSMTLFRLAAPDVAVFDQCLRKYFAGEPDPATLEIL
jgi:uncharacterized protein (DUF1810 family)